MKPQQEPSGRFQGKPFARFLLLCLVCLGMTVSGHMLFPGENVFPRTVRLFLTALAAVILAAGSGRLLKKYHPGEETLELSLSARSFYGFMAGAAGGFLIVALLAGALWVFTPFHFERGPLPPDAILPEAHRYFWGNFIEELIFHGYPLLVLTRAWGRKPALALLALCFGLFHLPGLHGAEAVRMVFTTGACAFLFSAVFLVSGSLWTAVGLHVAMNTALHAVSGLSGQDALLKPVFDVPPPPPNHDPGFWLFFAVPLLLAHVIFRWGNRCGRESAKGMNPAGLSPVKSGG